MQDHQTHYEAVGTLGNLVHSSPDIKRAVLQEGVLQPVINLLSCTCRDSLREAALLIGQFAQCDPRRGQNHGRGREVR
jgi:Armadillo/beta-catenin-like repeat